MTSDVGPLYTSRAFPRVLDLICIHVCVKFLQCQVQENGRPFPVIMPQIGATLVLTFVDFRWSMHR